MRTYVNIKQKTVYKCFNSECYEKFKTFLINFYERCFEISGTHEEMMDHYENVTLLGRNIKIIQSVRFQIWTGNLFDTHFVYYSQILFPYCFCAVFHLRFSKTLMTFKEMEKKNLYGQKYKIENQISIE